MSNIEYYNEDCMAGMARYPDKHFDLAIVDPPYGIGVNKMQLGNGKRKIYRGKDDWDKEPPSEEYFKELFRVSKNQIIWGGNYFKLPPTRCFLIWDKQLPEGFSFASCEFAWTSYDLSAKTFYKRPQGQDGGNRIHPTQKPVALYKWLLTNYAKPGDLILDTHVGSASSLIACHDLGFSAVGFEIDEEYYRISLERLQKHQRQIRFDLPEPEPDKLEQMVLDQC